MPKNTSVVLGEHFEAFVGAQVAAGRYGSTSEVLRAALRLLEEHENDVAAIRAALIAGEQSGPTRPADRAAFLMAMKEKHAGEAT